MKIVPEKKEMVNTSNVNDVVIVTVIICAIMNMDFLTWLKPDAENLWNRPYARTRKYASFFQYMCMLLRATKVVSHSCMALWYAFNNLFYIYKVMFAIYEMFWQLPACFSQFEFFFQGTGHICINSMWTFTAEILENKCLKWLYARIEHTLLLGLHNRSPVARSYTHTYIIRYVYRYTNSCSLARG